jgi:SAM-dependent methyltransferase
MFPEVGGGRGPLARLLQPAGVCTVVVDLDDQMLAGSLPPVVGADLGFLPVRERIVDAVAAVNCLYFLAEPADGLREARRVLRPSGVFVASAPSRWNDPARRRGSAMGKAQPVRQRGRAGHRRRGLRRRPRRDLGTELVAYRLPDRQAVADYLHGINVPDWQTKIDLLPPPVEITKRGAEIWARCP